MEGNGKGLRAIRGAAEYWGRSTALGSGAAQKL